MASARLRGMLCYMYGRFSAEMLPGPSFPAREAAARLSSGSLPLNLEEWFDWEALAGWIEAEVQELDWDHPLVQEHLRLHPDYRPRVLLKLLACGYATQVFGTKDILSRCRTEARYAGVCAGIVPFKHEVTTFRRKNRKLLVKVLTGLFTRALQHRQAVCGGPGLEELERTATVTAEVRLDIARHMDAGEED